MNTSDKKLLFYLYKIYTYVISFILKITLLLEQNPEELVSIEYLLVRSGLPSGHYQSVCR